MATISQKQNQNKAAGAYSGNSTAIDNPTWSDGEYLQFDVDQVGSGTAGADLTVTVVVG